MRTRIGILGDGQLAKMLIESKTGKDPWSFVVFGQDPHGPCENLAEHIYGELTDLESLSLFFSLCDVVTFENEFFCANLLDKYSEKLVPNLPSYRKIENKEVEKNSAREAGLLVSKFHAVSLDEVKWQGNPIVLKKPKGSYDGYGTYLFQKEEDLHKLKMELSPTEDFLSEEFLNFEKELAITLVRSKSGDVEYYPVVETLQKDGKCVRVQYPAGVPSVTEKEVQRQAKLLVDSIGYVGVMSIEFFWQEKDAKVLFNECSPRPHNSAHYSMDVCSCDQFRNHLLAITGGEIEKVDLNAESFVMFNILGTSGGDPKLEVPKVSSLHKVHLYNKKHSKLGRKMGHINLWGNALDSLVEDAEHLKEGVRI